MKQNMSTISISVSLYMCDAFRVDTQKVTPKIKQTHRTHARKKNSQVKQN